MALPATENFAGAAAALSGSWTQANTGATTIRRDGAGLGTQTTTDASSDNYAYWNADTFNNNQYSQFVWKSGSAGSGFCEVACRASGTGAGTKLYQMQASGSASSGETALWLDNAGVFTNLANYTLAFAANDVQRIEANGTAIRGFKNGTGVGVAVTNATLAAGAAGIGAYWDSSGAPTFDDWEGGDLGVAATYVPYNWRPVMLPIMSR